LAIGASFVERKQVDEASQQLIVARKEGIHTWEASLLGGFMLCSDSD
jgi:hypothetical protein